ncbi:MAG: HAD family hydrolase, partial [Brevinematia bacterium]
VVELFKKVLEYRKIFSEDTLQQCIKLMKEEYSKNYTKKTKPYEGIYELLDFLKANNYKISVLSNKQHLFTLELVKHFFKDYNFVSVKGIESPNERKPNPKLAIEIAKEMDIKPKEIFLVGDSANDILTAKNCGMISIGVTWGFKNIDEIISSNPNYIVNHPSEIKNIITINKNHSYLPKK